MLDPALGFRSLVSSGTSVPTAHPLAGYPPRQLPPALLLPAPALSPLQSCKVVYLDECTEWKPSFHLGSSKQNNASFSGHLLDMCPFLTMVALDLSLAHDAFLPGPDLLPTLFFNMHFQSQNPRIWDIEPVSADLGSEHYRSGGLVSLVRTRQPVLPSLNTSQASSLSPTSFALRAP